MSELKKNFMVENIGAILETPASEDVVNMYNMGAYDYDEGSRLLNYKEPGILKELFPAFNVSKDAAILELAVGIGLNGQVLHDLGYSNIDALDGSDEMVKRANERKVYRSCMQMMVTPDKELPFERHSYDAVLLIGCILKNHIKPECLLNILPLLKSGGLIYYSTYEDDVTKMAEQYMAANSMKRIDGFPKVYVQGIDKLETVTVDAFIKP